LDYFHQENGDQFLLAREETYMLRWERDPQEQSLANDHRMKMEVLLLSSYSRCIWRIAVLGWSVWWTTFRRNCDLRINRHRTGIGLAAI